MSNFLSLITAIALSFLTAVLGFNFAIKGFYQKKSWERRVQAYEEIVAALFMTLCSIALYKKKTTGKALECQSSKNASFFRTILLPSLQ